MFAALPVLHIYYAKHTVKKRPQNADIQQLQHTVVLTTENICKLESSHSLQTSTKAMLFQHSLSDEIKQAEVLSAFQAIVAFSTLT